MGSLKGSSLPHHLLLSLLSYPPLDLKSLGGGGQTEKEKSYFFFKGRRAKSPPPPLSPNSPFFQGNPKAPLRERGKEKFRAEVVKDKGEEKKKKLFSFSLFLFRPHPRLPKLSFLPSPGFFSFLAPLSVSTLHQGGLCCSPHSALLFGWPDTLLRTYV